MSKAPWANLREADRATLRTTIAFLTGRLQERASIEWALQLNYKDSALCSAVRALLEGPEGQEISDPWRSAWLLIEESWNKPPTDSDLSIGPHLIRRRLVTGDRSRALVERIIELVEPQTQGRADIEVAATSTGVAEISAQS